MRLTIGHATLAAPPCLFGGFAGCVLTVNLMEISVTQTGCTLFRHFLRNGDEFEHMLRGHNCVSLDIFPDRRSNAKAFQLKGSTAYLFICFIRDKAKGLSDN